MMEFHSLTDVWKYYDDIERKNFLSSDIVIAINNLPESILNSDICRYESLAFNFSENSSDRHWNLYYGPQFTFIKNDTKEELCIPSLNDITPEIIEYWENRAQVVKNPLLKMRYTGLVFVFKKKLFNVEPDYRSIKLAHINALFDVVNGEEELVQKIVRMSMQNALNIGEKIEIIDDFLNEMTYDFNTANAITHLYSLMKKMNSDIRRPDTDVKILADEFKTYQDMLYILGIEVDLLPLSEEEKTLVLDWQSARKNKDFAKADELRNKINELGIRL